MRGEVTDRMVERNGWAKWLGDEDWRGLLEVARGNKQANMQVDRSG